MSGSKKRKKSVKKTASISKSDNTKFLLSPQMPTTRKQNKTYQVLRGLQAGERYQQKPDDFISHLSMKGVFMYKKKKCILSDGILKIYSASGDVKYIIDLGISIVAYLVSARRITINTDVEMYRFTTPNAASFKQWIDALYVHRLYRQDRINFQESDTSTDVEKLRVLHNDLKTQLLKIQANVGKLTDKARKGDSITTDVVEALQLHQKYETNFDKIFGPRVESAQVGSLTTISEEKKKSRVSSLSKISLSSQSVLSGTRTESKNSTESIDEASEEATDKSTPVDVFETKLEAPVVKKIPYKYRDHLPVPMITCDLSLWHILKSSIGKDLTRISLPIEMFEPLGVLQVLCEELEYSQLLDQASETNDPALRLALIAAFAVSRYAATGTRPFRKPFNPIEGETYENIREDLGWWYFAEQVSHHPSVSALHSKGKHWEMSQNVSFDLAFWGRSITAEPKSPIDLVIKKYNETYRWNKVKTSINNLIGGTRYIDHTGDMIIKCSNKLSCKLNFKKYTHEVTGNVCDPQGTVIYPICGKWSESISIGPSSENRCIWSKTPLPSNSSKYYGFTSFAMTLNELTPELRSVLPHTDTRFRTDQKFLEEGRIEEAKEQKNILEENQRSRRKSREYIPKWFHVENGNSKKIKNYHFNNRYWEARKNNFKGIVFDKLWPNIV